MKKIVGLAVIGFVLGCSWAAHAKSNFTVDNAAAPSSVDSKQRDDMKKRLEEKKKELNGSEWKVDLSSGAIKESEDVLTFQNQQVKSKFFSDKGFPASNYTISLPEGSDTATWETMQTHPKGNVVFMRGEWKEKTMRGIISEQLDENKTKDHNFASTTVESVPTTTEKPEEEKAVEAAPLPTISDTTPAIEPESAVVAPFNPGTTDEIPSDSGSQTQRYR